MFRTFSTQATRAREEQCEPCEKIDCLQSAIFFLNPSSSYLIQRDCKPRLYYYRDLRPRFSRFPTSPLACLGFACSNFAKKNKSSQSSEKKVFFVKAKFFIVLRGVKNPWAQFGQRHSFHRISARPKMGNGMGSYRRTTGKIITL